MRQAAGPGEDESASGRSARADLLHLAALSGLGLFVELLLIRWLDAQIRPLAYVKNLALIASFLGLGIGYARAGRARTLHPTAVLFLVLALSAGTLFVTLPDNAITGPAGPESNLGGAAGATGAGLAPFYLLIAAVFTLVVLTMLPLGRIAGAFMSGVPALRAYTVNVAGALGGILLFVGLAALSVPPWAGALLACGVALLYLRPASIAQLTSALFAGLAVAGMLWVDHRGDVSTVWSPYNKIEVQRLKPWVGADPEVSPAWELRVQNLYYQHILDLGPDRLNAVAMAYPLAGRAASAYDFPYLFKKPRRVLVAGAGTGNDVAAALRRGAEEVVAVEIDPRIVDIGRRLHPEHPYDDPRVQVVVDDARAYLKRPGPPFDLIVFGLLDAHSSLFSSLSSTIRLDNYVYTVEAMRESLARLAPDGVLFLSVYVEQPWIASRLEAMLREAWGRPPLTAPAYYDGRLFFAGPGAPKADAPLDLIVGLPPGESDAHPAGPMATDDWPFLYLRHRAVPPTVVSASIAMLLAGALIVALAFRGAVRIDRHLFFLGAGFLLIETRTIAQLGLVFGATWRVSAIAIAGILALILLANVVVERRGVPPRLSLYAVLGLILVLNFLVRPGAALGSALPGRMVMTAFLLAPLFVAGLLFAAAVRERGDLAPALASNLVGAVLGGLLENLSMLTGIAALSLLALALYAASFRR
ncbi:MAG TPA: methyltransferase domain-containing protein [Candidatus Polarisedimenticolia bacterium]|nr:methyltransferase domain-containing protein [Candidatus Polarisedimenticolia bacterium]